MDLNKVTKLINKYSIYKLFKRVIFKKIYNTYKKYQETNFYHEISIDHFKEFKPKNNIFSISALNIKCFTNKSEIIDIANKIANNYHCFLGLKNEYLGKVIDWNKDYNSGYVFDKKFYKKININPKEGVDIKYVWELSRLNHLITLGQAYFISKDDKYVLIFRDQINSWIKDNPVKYSVNWKSTMEVSLRMMNLIVLYYFFSESNKIEKEFWWKYFSIIYLHGLFIIDNLEYGLVSGNHYLSNLAALIYLSLFMGDIENKKISTKINIIRRFALNHFKQEVLLQFNKDGTNIEGSIYYHKFVSELVLNCLILLEQNKMIINKKIKNRVENAFNFIMNYIMINGEAPLIGDVDNGIVHNWNTKDHNDPKNHKSILAVAGQFFNRNDFKKVANNINISAIFLIGEYKEYKNEVTLINNFFEDGGFYIYRNKIYYIIIRCGELSLKCGHSHNDQLSFYLNVSGEDIFVDAGNYSYHIDMNIRNYFKSTRCHNTIIVNNEEQNKFDKNKSFSMVDQTRAKAILVNNNRFIGGHSGYKKYGFVQREFRLENNKIVIYDSINKTTDDIIKFIISFHISPYLKIKFIYTDKVILEGNNVEICLQVEDKIEIRNYYYSNSYGEKIISKVVYIESNRSCLKSEIKIKFKGDDYAENWYDC